MQPGDLRFRKSMEMISDGSEIALGVRFLCLIRSLKARTIGLSVLGGSGHRATQGLIDRHAFPAIWNVTIEFEPLELLERTCHCAAVVAAQWLVLIKGYSCAVSRCKR